MPPIIDELLSSATLRRFSAVLLALVSLHCGSGGAEPGTTGGGDGGHGGSNCSTPAGTEVFALGTGEKCFAPVIEGQALPMIQGPQGGYHLWLAIGCSDCGSAARLRYGIKDPSTQTWIAETGALEAMAKLEGEGWGQMAGITAFLPGRVWEPSKVLPKGTSVVLSAEVLSEDGASTKHEATIKVVIGDVEIWNPCDPNPESCGTLSSSPCCTKGSPN